MPPRLGALLAVLFWGVSFVATKAVIREISPTTLIFTRAGLGTALLAAILALRRQSALPPRDARLSPAGWLAAIFLGLACSGLGYLFWYGALERVEASRVAALLYLEPLVTLAAAVVFLGEAVPITTVAGGLLVVAGVVLVQTAREAGPPASLDPAGGARRS